MSRRYSRPVRGSRIGGRRLVHFHDAGCLHDRRLLLALGEALGTLAIDIDARKFLAVVIVHGDLPMLVFAPPILVKPAGLASFGLLSHCLSTP